MERRLLTSRTSISLLLATLFCCSSYSQPFALIHVQMDTNEATEPEYMGQSGIHLYGVSPLRMDDGIYVNVNHTNLALELYKLHPEIALLLNNKLSITNDIGSLIVYGSDKIRPYIIEKTEEEAGCNIVGYLNEIDIDEINIFLDQHKFEFIENVQEYYDNTSSDVKSMLSKFQGPGNIEHIHAYLKDISQFFKACKQQNLNIVIVYNG